MTTRDLGRHAILRRAHDEVFLSYASEDHHFAELIQLKLASENITVWRDRDHVRVGSDWRTGINQAIDASDAVLVALSANSAGSAYVTYEWAFAMGHTLT